jgi:hypothetical protein
MWTDFIRALLEAIHHLSSCSKQLDICLADASLIAGYLHLVGREWLAPNERSWMVTNAIFDTAVNMRRQGQSWSSILAEFTEVDPVTLIWLVGNYIDRYPTRYRYAWSY